MTKLFQPSSFLYAACILAIHFGTTHAGSGSAFTGTSSWLNWGDWGAKHWIEELCHWSGFCTDVCYGDLGCFESTLECHKDFFPPMTPEEILTFFVLHTRMQEMLGIDSEELDRKNSSTVLTSTFDPMLKTVVIVHGWGEDSTRDWVVDMTDSLLRKDDVNVITVDWFEGADELNYLKAMQNIRVVGREVGQFLRLLANEVGANITNFHLIGHSLGAHAAGYAGEEQPGIGRISALDAAGPGFEGTEAPCRLDHSDAIFVDAIHTDSDLLTNGGAGIQEEVGHSDFFPNGGFDQPGCYWWQLGCDHAKSHEYFIESIKYSACKFKAIPCTSEEDFFSGRCNICGYDGCPSMGYSSEESHARGKFYLSTSAQTSYCTRQKRMWKKHFTRKREYRWKRSERKAHAYS